MESVCSLDLVNSCTWSGNGGGNFQQVLTLF